MHKSRYVLIILLVVGLNGCQHGILGKRNAELCCPTDIRKTHVGYFGEDAIFCPPCGPDHEYYGHKPTCWRDWPSTGADWRDGTCGPGITCAPGVEDSAVGPEIEPERLSEVPEKTVEFMPSSQPNSANSTETNDWSLVPLLPAR